MIHDLFIKRQLFLLNSGFWFSINFFYRFQNIPPLE
jgi:hypothetical protein